MERTPEAWVPRMCGAGPEMMHPEAWLGPEDEAVLMSPEEAADLNRRLLPGLPFSPVFPFCLAVLPERLPGKTVRALMDSLSMPECPERVYRRGRPTEKAWWQELRENMAAGEIPEEVTVRFGFCVRRDTLNFWPTDSFVGETPEDVFFNCNTNSECSPLQPLAVLHESRDGEWLFCVMVHMAGWTHRSCVALCPDRKDWVRRQQPSEVLTVLGRELRLGDDPLCPALSGLLLPMGTALPLMRPEEVPGLIRGRSLWGSYTVRLPLRGEDGGIRDELCLIPVSDPVCVGPLPLSRANILRQAFRRLGDRYGWGGALHANDCSGIIREIFSCFGIILPRNACEIQKWGFPPEAGEARPLRLVLKGMTAEEKLRELEKTRPGAILYMPGHIVLFLGIRQGRPWAISATGSVCREGCTVPVMSVCINDLNVKRKNGQSWLESAETLIRL